MKKFILILLITSLLIPLSAFANTIVKIDREKGVYIDGRGQIPSYECVPPPHPENIPEMSNPVRTVEPFELYYDTNILGKHRKEYMTPLISGYNVHYSNRYNQLFYSKQQFKNVWCSGQQNVNGFDCVTENYAFIYGEVYNWSSIVATIPFRTLRAKANGKKLALLLMVNEIATDAEYISGAKQYADLVNLPIFFTVIDCLIPQENIAI